MRSALGSILRGQELFSMLFFCVVCYLENKFLSCLRVVCACCTVGSSSHLSSTEVHDESHCVHVENDIGLFTGASAVSLTTERRVSLLHDVWTPDQSFNFPAGKRNLKFQLRWLGRWHWLCYSKEQSGAFCKFCVLFSPCGGGVGCQPLGRLVTTPFQGRS